MLIRIVFFLGLLVFTSCEKEVITSSFRIVPTGLALDESELDTSLSALHFSHRYASGNVSFSDGQQQFDFNTGRVHLDKFYFELPVGEYLMEILVDTASPYGQTGASFNALAQNVDITDSTDIVPVDLEATCSLFLISDPNDELNEPPSIIRRYTYSSEYFLAFAMVQDDSSGLYYSYFSPDPQPENPSAYVWFYKSRPDVETGGFSTVNLNLGKIYLFEILE